MPSKPRTLPLGVIVLVSLLTVFFIGDVFATELNFDITLPSSDVLVKKEAGKAVISVKGGDYRPLAQPGMPDVPGRIISIVLPQGEEVADFSFISGSRRSIASNLSLAVCPPTVAEDGVIGTGPGLFERAEKGGTFPPSLGKYLGTGYLHGYAIASFLVTPLQYENGTLYLNENISLEVTTGPASGTKDIALRERYREGFREGVARTISSFVLNPDQLAGYVFDEVMVPRPKGGFQPTAAPSLEGSPVDYIIITSDSLKNAYQRLADWKTAKGVPTVVKTVEWIEANYKNGVDIQETIRNFIRDAYQKWGVTWVLLGGDTDVIPARYAISRFYQGGTFVPTDMYFACLDGSWNETHDQYWGEGYYYVPLDNPDLYAEVYLSRLPTSTTSDVDIMIDKIISYETPFNRDYTNKVELLAEVLFPVDWVQGQPITLNGADLAEYMYSITMQGKPVDVTRSYETYDLFTGAVPESKQATIDSMNAGKNIFNHIGHGFRFNLSVADASVLNDDADALTNQDRYFLLYMLNCTAAAYDYYCLAEHFLRNPSGGAVSIVGANRSAFPNASSYYMNEFYDLLFNQSVVHVGETFARSRLPRTPSAEVGDNVDLWTHYIYTILSDPELPLWTGSVDTLDVFHVANVGLGENTILVSVTDNGMPVDSAMVCLYKGADDYQYQPTNTLGNATFNFTCEQPGSISVVVTGLNHARHQSYIVVDPSVTSYMDYAGMSVDDDSTGVTFGNGDGNVDAGETIEFTLSLANTGGADADGVWLVLRTGDSLVTIQDSTAYVGFVSAGMTAAAADPVRIQFSPDIPDEGVIDFTLEIHDTLGNVYNDAFSKVVHSPVLDLVIVRFDDSAPIGNGDGNIDPGEQFLLYCKMKNYGSGKASGLTASLNDIGNGFVFYDSVDVYTDLDRMVSAENTNGFLISEDYPGVENYIEFTLTDIFGHVYMDSFELRRPDPPTNLLFDSSKGLDRIEVAWSKSTSADAAKYNVYHSMTSGGPYQLVSADPLDHTVFMDTGLTPSTKYYYVVTTIDKSGNESVFSAEYTGTTNPPQLGGWPIEMSDYTVSSPAVGDIDGDGDLEVVVGDRYVYAWHHNGVELRDGDNDPQSWGVLNTYGQDFVSPITLAKLDTVPGLDMVAVSYTTKEVYCFNYQGNILSGWPQTTENNARSAPVIADLDGDGSFEIVLVDQGGVIYAWNTDGTEFRDGDNNPATQGVFYRTPAPPAWHYQTPAVCDIDNDNMDEIILSTLADSIYVLNGDGTEVPGWPYGASNYIVGSVAVGDVDNDGEIEVAAVSKSQGVIVLNPDGSMLSGWPKWVPSYTFFNPSPALADIDGDGFLEVFVAGSDGKLYAFNHDGRTGPLQVE